MRNMYDIHMYPYNRTFIFVMQPHFRKSKGRVSMHAAKSSKPGSGPRFTDSHSTGPQQRAALM